MTKPGIQIEYENDDFLVLNKPADLPVYSTKKREHEDSAVSLLVKKNPQIRKIGDPERPGIVHRLDRQTSGLLVVAKTKTGFEFLKRLFKSREIVKEYQALVYGELPRHGVIEKPLTKIGQRGRSRVRVDEEGKEAVTEYWSLASYVRPLLAFPPQKPHGLLGDPYFGHPPHPPAACLPARQGRAGLLGREKTNRTLSPGDGERGREVTVPLDRFTLLRVRLHTGRTHQIRVHLASIGHPVMGDNLYGKPRSFQLKDILPRQFLHASRLEFKLMDGTTWLEVESELPEDLKKALKQLNKIAI